MKKTILIIEDDEFLKGLEAKKIEQEGYIVLVANNSTEAFKHIDKTNSIDLIILDLLLTGADGYEILRMLKDNPKASMIPVIIFSNLSEKKDIKKANELGVNDFFVKSSFTLDELVKKIKGLIG